MERIYKVAIIGCGVMGEAHIVAIHAMDQMVVSYACDKDIEKAELFYKRYHVGAVTTDYNEILEDETVDIVIIATPPSTHLALVQECLMHHKHVLCEKPIATTLEDSKEFVRIVKAHPECRVLIGNILRHNKTYQKVAEMIHNGAIGHPIVFRMIQNHHPMNWPFYLANLKDSAPLVNCGIHYVDVMEWFSGERVVEVNAIGSRTAFDVPCDTYNYGMMTLKFSDGSIGYYEAGWANTCASDNLKEFIGPTGRIRLVYQKDRSSHQEEGDLLEYYRYPEKTYETINLLSNRKPTDEQLLYLVRMIETGCDAVPTMDEVLSCMETCLDADKQAKKCAAVVKIRED